MVVHQQAFLVGRIEGVENRLKFILTSDLNPRNTAMCKIGELLLTVSWYIGRGTFHDGKEGVCGLEVTTVDLFCDNPLLPAIV